MMPGMKTKGLRTACLLLFAAGVSRLCLADSAPAGFQAEEAALCARLALSNQQWASVRWEVSLTEARDRAKREDKPIFLVVNTGNVLGFV